GSIDFTAQYHCIRASKHRWSRTEDEVIILLVAGEQGVKGQRLEGGGGGRGHGTSSNHVEVIHLCALDTLWPEIGGGEHVSQSRRKRTAQRAMEEGLVEITVYQERTLACAGGDHR